MAGTMTFTHDKNGPINILIGDWTSTAGGAADATTTFKIIGTIRKIVTNPDGVDAPTANYDIVITDEEGVDVLGLSQKDVQNRHTADTEQIVPVLLNYDATPIGIAAFPVVADLLKVAVSNAGNAKKGKVLIYYHREA